MKTVTLTDKQFKTALRICYYQSEEHPCEMSTLYFTERNGIIFNFDLNMDNGEFVCESSIKGVPVVLTEIQAGIVIHSLEETYKDYHEAEDTTEEDRLFAYLENSSYDTYSDERKGLNR